MHPQMKLAEAQPFAAMQCAQRGFDGKVGTVTSGPDDRSHHLVTECCRHHSGTYGRR